MRELNRNSKILWGQKALLRLDFHSELQSFYFAFYILSPQKKCILIQKVSNIKHAMYANENTLKACIMIESLVGTDVGVVNILNMMENNGTK